MGSREKEKAFVGFREAPVNFEPTFKVYKNKSLHYQKKRSPAWCDRVLWRSAFGFEDDLRCTRYWNSLKVETSDHKPVYAEFVVKTWERPPGICDQTGPVPIVYEFVRAENL